MNLNQLYCFREICLSKSMTAAARKCYQSTKNLSRMVKALEGEPLPPAIMEFEKFVLQQLRLHKE